MKLAFIALAIPLLAVACNWETDLPEEITSIKVDTSRELVVTDEHIVSGPLARNENDAPLSFRHAVSSLAIRPGAMLRWMKAWSERLPPDRSQLFDEKITRRWLGADQELDLGAAPFRLIAITNRTDLSMLPDRAGGGGEGRLVFALTDGPADDSSSASLPFTVIFEYAQEGSAQSWTQRWHALGSASEPEFPAALTALTETFVAKGALAQIRTADAFTGPMLLHQFQIASGEIAPTTVRNTPDWQRVAEPALREFASSHGQEIEDGTALLPSEWWAASSSIAEQPPSYVAALPQHDALARGTCGGCHAQSDNGFHIDPLAMGAKRLSRFLVDPSKDRDELRRRVEWMQIMLHEGG